MIIGIEKTKRKCKCRNCQKVMYKGDNRAIYVYDNGSGNYYHGFICIPCAKKKIMELYMKILRCTDV